MSSRFFLFALMAFAFAPVQAGEKPRPILGTVRILAPEGTALFPDKAAIEVLGGGITWAEGPVWMKDEKDAAKGRLLFSDVPANKIYAWEEGKRPLEVWLAPSGYTGANPYSKESGSNGLALDAKGQLLACEHGDRRVSLLTANGGKITLADRFEGKRFNSPNDLCVHSSGSIYFTDPPYGLAGGADGPNRELPFCGVFRIGADGSVKAIITDLPRPNGIALSPDEKTLYVAQSDPAQPVVMAYPLQEDGAVGQGRVFWDAKPLLGEGPGLPDGLKVDKEGRLWTSGPGGLWVIDTQGKALAHLHTGVTTANCAWGNDGTVLYLTADSWLCRIPTATKGAGWK